MVAIVMNSGAGEMMMGMVDEVEIVSGQVLQLGPCLDVSGKLNVVAFILGEGIMMWWTCCRSYRMVVSSGRRPAAAAPSSSSMRWEMRCSLGKTRKMIIIRDNMNFTDAEILAKWALLSFLTCFQRFAGRSV
jgi:hypothetical protein